MSFEKFVSFNRSIDKHTHSPACRFRLHCVACRRSARYGTDGFREVLHRVLPRASDTDFLYLAWKRVCLRSGETAGPDGVTSDDFGSTSSMVFQNLRSLRDAIRSEDYYPGTTRAYRIPKASGSGTRTIEVPDFCDRVVQASLLMVLQPLLDPLFDPGSMGSRPGKSRFLALVEIERLIHVGFSFVVSVDVRDAFPSVPHTRLQQVLEKYVGESDALVDLLFEIIRGGGRRRGLCQGGSLSPLLMNLYLHHFVDSRWPAVCPRSPFLLRYVDNVAVCCDSSARAIEARAALTSRFDGAGLKLRPASTVTAPDLLAGGVVNWMGMTLSCVGDDVQMRVPDANWNNLARKLSSAMTSASADTDSDVCGRIIGWLNEVGPAYLYEDGVAARARMNAILDDLGVGQQVSRKKFDAVWRQAYLRWRRFRRQHLPGDFCL